MHIHLNYVAEGFPEEARTFFEANKAEFEEEHENELRVLRPISLPDHVTNNVLAKKYRENKYRLTLSRPAYENLVAFFESREQKRGQALLVIMGDYCNIITKSREEDINFGFAAMLARANEIDSFPGEDEGIPGHHPGSAYTGDNPNLATVLPRLKLGKLPLEAQLEVDLRGDLQDLDDEEKRTNNQMALASHIEVLDAMIKNEDGDEVPSRNELPFPPSEARDVQMEVNKIREYRCRFRFPTVTQGKVPPVSICMFTFHNTYDR